MHVVAIKAAVLRHKNPHLAIESLEMEGPKDDEVLVRIAASGICHTDIDFIEDWAGGAVVLGHEGAGVVERVGDKVKSVKRGDHVVLSYQSCGDCIQCRNGHPTHCKHFWDANFGFQHLDGSNALQRSGVLGHFFGQYSFATHSLATERNASTEGGSREPRDRLFRSSASYGMMVLWLKVARKAGNHMLLKTGHFHFGRNRTFSLWLDIV